MDKTNLISMLNTLTSKTKPVALFGKSFLVKEFFENHRNQHELNFELLILCTSQGVILSCFAGDKGCDLTGFTINFTALENSHEEVMVHKGLKDYFIITDNQPELIPEINAILTEIDTLIRLFDRASQKNQKLLGFLDAAQNSISLYDKQANLLFANTNFCKYMNIENRNQVIGMNINDILEFSGLTVYSMENNSNKLKMFDVLKTGLPVLDWEVRLESSKSINKVQFASNDMFPVLDDQGQIEGLIEISRSQQQDIRRTRKLIGLSAEYKFEDIIGNSTVIRRTIDQAKQFAESSFNCLVTGESGVGKELFVQSIHNHSSRRKGPFVAINCASFPEGLIESELFGYVSGAFTGASNKGQMGKFELANGGTIFLDEIGELPYHFQAKLLRVLETLTVTRIGSTQPIPIATRLIAATNRDLNEMVSKGLFRQDLYYRLAVLSIEIPPLRDREKDIISLAETFLFKVAHSNMDTKKTLSDSAKELLLEYSWPGNVRELRNVVSRAIILSESEEISRQTLELSMPAKGFNLNNRTNLSPEERILSRKSEIDKSYVNLLKEALSITKGNKKQAAEIIGVSRKTLYRMMEKYGMED